MEGNAATKGSPPRRKLFCDAFLLQWRAGDGAYLGGEAVEAVRVVLVEARDRRLEVAVDDGDRADAGPLEEGLEQHALDPDARAGQVLQLRGRDADGGGGELAGDDGDEDGHHEDHGVVYGDVEDVAHGALELQRAAAGDDAFHG